MANQYQFKTDLGDVYIPIADGEYEIQDMSASYSTGQCYLQFYDAQKSPVTPTAGTVTFKASPFAADQWLGSSNGSDTIDATAVEAGESSYTTPKFSGCVISSKMTLADITGAVYVSAYHWRE